MIDLSVSMLDIDLVLISLCILFVAGLIQGLFGLGFAMVSTPMLGLFLDYRVAVMLAAVPLWFIACRYIFTMRKVIKSSIVVKSLVPPIMVGSVFGVIFYAILPVNANYALLGLLLLLSAFLPLILRYFNLIGDEPYLRGARPLGFFAGVTEALMNVGAPFILLFSGISNLRRRQQMLALNLCFAVGKTIQITLISLLIPVGISWIHILLAVVSSSFGFVAGDWFSGEWSEKVFRKVLFVFLIIMSLAMGVRALTAQ
jgi:uncharacterized membrane protein YfcA